ncbi:MAG: murF, partial [Modestobacter sp.]|nr:murF [Modestobacter sp.]
MIALDLGEVAAAVGGELVLPAGAATPGPVTGSVRVDSRAVGAGDLFVALAGERVDGADFVPAAAAAGAAAALT